MREPAPTVCDTTSQQVGRFGAFAAKGPAKVIDAASDMGVNLYMYTEGNPMKFRDPSGMSKKDDFWSNVRQDMTKGFTDLIKYNNDMGKLAVTYHFSGMTPEAFALFYTFGK